VLVLVAVKSIKGVSQDRRKGKPLQLGRREVAGSMRKVVAPHKTPHGQDVEGTTADQVHRSCNGPSGCHYEHPETAAHRERERAQPYSGKR
jgi:hypothetical protein